jgi:Zn-dependent protease
MAIIMSPESILIFQLAILLISVVIHEVSHGAVANLLGDPTARLSGRLTLNPIAHIDPFGSIILPVLLLISQSGFVFGWAKPVPFNPYNLRGGKWGPALVAAAGPASNLIIASIFALLLRIGAVPVVATPLFVYVVIINVVLGIFNSIPLPPFDGFKIISPLLPYRMYQKAALFEASFGLMLIPLVVIFFFFFLAGPFSAVISFVTNFLLG